MTTETTVDYETARAALTEVARTTGTTVVTVDRAMLEAVLDGSGLDDRVELARIYQQFCAMPFGGIAHFSYPANSRERLTLVQIRENLERLRNVLDSVIDDHERERAELGTYRRLTSAVREVVALIAPTVPDDE